MTKFSKALILCAALGASGVTMAQGAADLQMFQDMQKFVSMDANKDGMVSKAEFMKMMDKSFEMAAKKMGAKGDKMTEAQFKEFTDMLSRRGG
jgi:Ca2+-binding EF-hand superfamily protein